MEEEFLYEVSISAKLEEFKRRRLEEKEDVSVGGSKWGAEVEEDVSMNDGH